MYAKVHVAATFISLPYTPLSKYRVFCGMLVLKEQCHRLEQNEKTRLTDDETKFFRKAFVIVTCFLVPESLKSRCVYMYIEIIEKWKMY